MLQFSHQNSCNLCLLLFFSEIRIYVAKSLICVFSTEECIFQVSFNLPSKKERIDNNFLHRLLFLFKILDSVFELYTEMRLIAENEKKNPDFGHWTFTTILVYIIQH